jgi:DNA modification methylase
MSDLSWTSDFVPLGSLVEYERNPVQISKRDATELAKSLKKFGHIIPYTAAAPKNGGEIPILDGHQRKKVEIELLNVSPETMVEVRFPSRALTDKERQEAIIRLRKNTGEFDPDALLNWFESDDLIEWGFDEKELERIGFEFDEGRDAEPEIDRAAELLEKWQVKLGDMFKVGGHRIICGDCADEYIIERVMQGEKAALFETDPPYGIDYDSAQLHRNETHYDAIERDKLKEDELQAWLEVVFMNLRPHMKDNCAWYLWHPMLTQGYFMAAAAAAAVIISRQIIWVKPQFIFGRGEYHWMHELCFYGWVKGNRPPFYGERNQTTVWNIGYDGKRNDRMHPTEKPPELWYAPIKNHTREGEVCLEPFSGSGSQMVACENLRRRCMAIELDPKYVAVALERMSVAFEGIQIERLS